MPKINPSDHQSSNNDRRSIEPMKAGKKILAPASASFRYTMNQERYCEIFYVCLHDLDNKENGDVGKTISQRYLLRESHNWRWAELAAVLMYSDVFDNEDPKDVQALLLKNGNRIKVDLVDDEYNGKKRLQMRNLSKVLKDGKVPEYTDSEVKHVSEAESNYAKVNEYRIEQGWTTEILPKYQKSTSNEPDENDDWDIPDDDDNNDIPF